MKTLLILLLFPILAYSNVGVLYPQRLSNIQEMATSLEIIIMSDFGRMGGIYVQTEWQMKTGRNQIESWNTINAYLTVRPYQIFETYLTLGKNTCESPVISNKRICRAWLSYFKFIDARKYYGVPFPGNDIIASKRLWTAHEVSIEEAIKSNPGLLDSPSVPVEERLYLKGWIKFVHILATSKLPTGEKFVRLLAAKTSPECSPLGAGHCRVEDQPKSVRAFVKEMMAYGRLTTKKPSSN